MVGPQGVQQAREGAKGVKRFEERLEHRPRWGIGLHVDIARGEEPRAPRDPREHGAAVGLVQTPPLETLPPRMEFDVAPGAVQASEEAIMRIARIVDPLLVGEEGAKPRPPFQHMLPVVRAAGQATHLQAHTDADVVHRHLGEPPLAPVAMLGRRPTLALSFVNEPHAGCGPAQGDRIVVYGRLARRRFAVFQHLLAGRRTDGDDRQFRHRCREELRAPPTYEQRRLS